MKSHIVVGLGYGDEGKGTWVDHLVRKHGVKYVVRFNGGAQALHHVRSPQGVLHGFSQFGSGTLVPGTMTCLSRYMLVEPESLLREAEVLESKGVANVLSRVIISENAPIIPPQNRLLSRIMEVFRGATRHGSCGYGIGLTRQDIELFGDQALYMRDFRDDKVYDKLEWLGKDKVKKAQEFFAPQTAGMLQQLETVDLDYYSDFFMDFYDKVTVVSEDEFLSILRENDTVFEGAQGVLLDEFVGTYPHCTRTVTTFENAERLLLDAGFSGTKERIGLLRGYGHRHGAGPFVTEDTTLKLASCDNATNAWQGKFRLGWFDTLTARYALEVTGGVDTLAVTNLDRMDVLDSIKIGVGYLSVDNELVYGDRIPIFNGDYPLLSKQSAVLQEAKPIYQTVNGWDDVHGMESYLDTLTELIDNPIHAYSVSSDHQKIYRANTFQMLACS